MWTGQGAKEAMERVCQALATTPEPDDDDYDDEIHVDEIHVDDVRREPLPAAAPAADADATGKPEDDDETQANSDWLVALRTGSPAGRKLHDHFVHMAAALETGDLPSQCPIDQVTTFLRVFVHGLTKTPTPFGLPKEQPKCIAICNWNGVKGIYYSNKPILIQMLAHTPTRLGPVDLAQSHLRRLWNHVAAKRGRSMIMCYSLPFQVSIDHLYWEVRTIERSAAGAVTDGQLVYRVGEEHASMAACTSAVEWSGSHPLLQHQYQAMTRELVAQDTDVDPGADVSSADGATGSKISTLEGIVTAVRAAAKQAENQHKLEKRALELEVRSLQQREVTIGALAETVVSTAQHNDGEELASLRVRNMTLQQAVGDKARAIAEYETRIKGDELAWEEARDKRKELEAALANATLVATRASANACKASGDLQAQVESLNRLNATNRKTIENLERQKQDAEIARRAAVQEADVHQTARQKAENGMQALCKKLESHDAINESQLAQLAQLERQGAGLRVAAQLVRAQRNAQAGAHAADVAKVRSEIEKEIESAQTAMRNARKELRTRERASTQLSAKCDRMTNELALSEQALEKTRVEHAESSTRVDCLDAQLRASKGALQAAEEAVAHLEQQAAEAREIAEPEPDPPPAKPAEAPAPSFDPKPKTAMELSLELGEAEVQLGNTIDRAAKAEARVAELEALEDKLALAEALAEKYKSKHDQAHVELADVRMEREALRAEAERLKAESRMGAVAAGGGAPKKLGGKGGKGAAAEAPPSPSKPGGAALEHLIGQASTALHTLADLARRNEDQARQLEEAHAALRTMQFGGYAQPMYKGGGYGQ